MSTIIETKAANVQYLGELTRMYPASTSYADSVRRHAEHVHHEASNLIETLNTSEPATTKAPALEVAQHAAEIAAAYLTRETVDNPNYLSGNARKLSDARAHMIDVATTHTDHLRNVETLKHESLLLVEIAKDAQETADRLAEAHAEAKEAALVEAVDELDTDEYRALECLKAAAAHRYEALRLTHIANTWNVDHAQAIAQNLEALDAESLSTPRVAYLQGQIDGFQIAPILRKFEYAEEYLLNFIDAAINYVDDTAAREALAETLSHHNVELPGIHTTDEPAELLPVWPHV